VYQKKEVIIIVALRCVISFIFLVSEFQVISQTSLDDAGYYLKVLPYEDNRLIT
jgi:hypothetical protein